jgi:hypothetical protein
MIFYQNFLYIIYFILLFNKMNREAQLAIFAIVATLGLLGIIAVESISIPQQQQAHAAVGCVSGTKAYVHSRGNCFHP